MKISTVALLGAVVFCSACGLMPVAEDGGRGGGAASGGGTSNGGGAASGGGTATGGGSSSGGGSTTGGGGSTGGGSATGGGSSTGGGGATGGGSATCSPACGAGRECCNGQCVNTSNNPQHCGGCNMQCSGATPYCFGTCMATPCSMDAGACLGGASCCGSQCCGAGQICCENEGPVSGFPTCHTVTAMEPTCPMGCSPQCASDRNIKKAITPIDEQKVLRSLEQMPISTWSYQSDADEVRHLGPMAQDFRAAFGLGVSELNYDPIDAHGVELAAIKALNSRVKQLEAENSKLEARLKALESKRR